MTALGKSGHLAQIRSWPGLGAAAMHVHMLTELYIEALLADEALADEVWNLWNAGLLTDDMAAWTEDVDSLVHMPIFAASNSSTRETIAVRRGSRRNMDL